MRSAALWLVIAWIAVADCASQGCVLPQHPTNGRYVPLDIDCPPKQADTPACKNVPGAKVPDNWFLYVKCNEGYTLDQEDNGYSQSTCTDGRWFPPLASCVYKLSNDPDKCSTPPFPENGKYEPLLIECAMNDKTQGILVSPGTIVPSACVLVYSCDSGYELSENDVISICHEGEWNPKRITCKGTGANPSTGNGLSRTPQFKGCPLPPQPENRLYCSFPCKECSSNPFDAQCSYPPGSTVNENIIKVQCSQGYALEGHALEGHSDYEPVACVDGKWNAKFPNCLKQCPPLESDALHIQCSYGTSQVQCSKPMLPGSSAKYQCRASHTEYPSLTLAGVYKRTLICQKDGTWSQNLPECSPICGVSGAGVTISPTIVNGLDTPLGAFPWHAGLFIINKDNGKWQNGCGGSLITNRLVLTAAHCVVLQEPSGLKIGIGKYQRSWYAIEEHSLKLDVLRIKIPEEYTADASYSWDIALVVLKQKVVFNNYIMPVCLNAPTPIDIEKQHSGYVVGWGKTMANGKESETLLHSNFTLMNHDRCQRAIPKVGSLLSFDKFCGAKDSESVVEKGDSGGGVTAVVNNLHYLIGIVSLKLGHISVFTDVSWHGHISWLSREMVNF